MINEKLNEYLEEADKRMKKTNGHSYVHTLKTRCRYCGRSPQQKGKCQHWFQTFIDHFRQVLRENGELT